MTFREKLAIEHPKAIGPSWRGGCAGCPITYGYELPSDSPCYNASPSHTMMCTACWDREIPEGKPLTEGIKDVAQVWEELKTEVLPTIKDPVNHPGHYESGKFECIDVMLETQGAEAVAGFCICNAFKYLYRHKRKNGIEDVKKARWYIDKYLEIVEEK